MIKYVRKSVRIWGDDMKTMSITQARQNLYKVVDSAIVDSEPVQITSKNGNVIVMSFENFESIQETLYLVSIPNMREKLLEGKATPVEECAEGIEGWDLD